MTGWAMTGWAMTGWAMTGCAIGAHCGPASYSTFSVAPGVTPGGTVTMTVWPVGAIAWNDAPGGVPIGTVTAIVLEWASCPITGCTRAISLMWYLV